jgi:hypothetical protein
VFGTADAACRANHRLDHPDEDKHNKNPLPEVDRAIHRTFEPFELFIRLTPTNVNPHHW